MRMLHGYMMSGMLPVQYKRFCVGANLGYIGDHFLYSMKAHYNQITQEEMEKSTHQALFEEIASSDMDGIDIITDGRHGWRKNAKDSDIVGIALIRFLHSSM